MSEVNGEAREKDREVPKFTFSNVSKDIYNGAKALVVDPSCNVIVVPIMVSLTSILGKVVISLISYTEIDFRTYMQQIRLVNQGERDYSFIEGDTGPIVYPAGFVQIYQVINWLTDDGKDINAAQLLFSYLLTLTNFLVSIVYLQTVIQPWPFYLLIMSKRILSIYVLRLFNDCFTTFLMVCVVLVLQQASFWYKRGGSMISFLLTLVASDLFSLAIATKMNALLYLPAFAIVSYFLTGENLVKWLVVLGVIPAIQIMIGWQFLLPLFNDEYASCIRWTYINQAFNFKRKFLYEWTVNWRFLSESVFSSDFFSRLLLALNALTLLIFIFTRFISPKITGKPLKSLVTDAISHPLTSTIKPNNLLLQEKTGPKLIMLIFSTTNIVGVLFARSLHYQFLSWYCWQLPFILYLANLNLVVSAIIWLAHEYCWNTFPSTPSSSGLLVLILGFLLIRVWSNTTLWFESHQGEKTTKEKKNV